MAIKENYPGEIFLKFLDEVKTPAGRIPHSLSAFYSLLEVEEVLQVRESLANLATYNEWKQLPPNFRTLVNVARAVKKIHAPRKGPRSKPVVRRRTGEIVRNRHGIPILRPRKPRRR